MNGIMDGINSEEILICLILVAIGYFIAIMFSRYSGNGFSIGGGKITCSEANDDWTPGFRSPGQCHFDGSDVDRDPNWEPWENTPCCMGGMIDDNNGSGACGYRKNVGGVGYCVQDGYFSDLDNNEDCTYHWSLLDRVIQCE